MRFYSKFLTKLRKCKLFDKQTPNYAYFMNVYERILAKISIKKFYRNVSVNSHTQKNE